MEAKQSLSGWQKEYNLVRKFSQAFRLKYMKEKCDAALSYINTAETIMEEEMPQYFSEETFVEWTATYIAPLKEFIKNKQHQAEEGLKQDTWPRRPIHQLV